MNTRKRNDFGSHDAQQHIRYVEVYTIDDPEEEEQPVQVKALRWDGDSYEVYGEAFRVGGTSLAGEVAAEERFWIVWRRDSQRWERLTAGTGQAFQVIRGVTTAAVAPTDVAFQIESVSAYEQNALVPSEPTWIAAPAGGVTLAEGDAVWAIYRFNQLAFDPGSGDVQVDWLMFEPGSSNTPPLREFELTATKTLAQDSATVKWLDLDGNLVGSDTTIYDPDQRFSGRAASYVGSERGFRGQASLRTDLAAEDPDRWEIITMERFAEWAVVSYNSSGETFHLVAGAFGGDEWNNRRPAADGSALAVSDPAAIVGRVPANGETSIVRLNDPDSSPPGYQLHGVRNEDRRVATSTSDTVPLELQSKLVDGGTYDSETDLIVKVDEIEDGGIKKLQLSYTPGGGGGSYTEGCGIDIADSVISVNVSALAGSGLGTNTGEGACELEVDLCEAIEALAVLQDKASGTYVLGVVDGLCTLIEVETCG
ncbi:MAG: hypothetical protein AB7G28_20630 [Pirellulales bacterium]